jgi:iron-sulfur cluster repair protein YtfE (RIC family)
MHAITEFMGQQHRHCDELFAEAENAAADGDWSEATPAWMGFCKALENHLQREEQCLFPAFEAQTGNTQGPTAVMRQEHAQMRALVAQMTEAAARQDQEAFLGGTDTLQILISQHNMKEEQILYPMTDQVLSDSAAMVETMQAQI